MESAETATQNDDGGLQSAAVATQAARYLLTRTQKYCACHTKSFQDVCRHVRMSGSATPATQNDITTCFDTFKKDRLCSFPHRHGEATRKTRDSRRDMLEHQNERFVRDILKFSCFVAPKSTSSYEFSHEAQKFSTSKSDVFFHKICHGICTLSPHTQP